MSTSSKEIKWFGMKLTPVQKNKIQRLANRRGVSQKKAIMDLVEKAIKEKETPVKSVPGSFYERNKDLIGAAQGPTDASTNPAYMEGYGK